MESVILKEEAVAADMCFGIFLLGMEYLEETSWSREQLADGLGSRGNSAGDGELDDLSQFNILGSFVIGEARSDGPRNSKIILTSSSEDGGGRKL